MQNAEQVETGMAVETPVFGAQHGFYQQRAEFRQCRVGHPEQPDPAESFAIGGFEQQSRLVRSARTSVDWQTQQRPQQSGGDDEHARNADDSETQDQAMQAPPG